MKIRRELLGSKIIHKRGTFIIEETKSFIKTAKALGLDVFEPIKPSEKKRKEVKKEIKDSLDADTNPGNE